MLKHITSDEYQAEVLNCKGKVLVDFFATWCGPCQMLSQVLEQVASEYPDIDFYKVNVDEEPDLAEKFGVMSIPTFVAIKNGEVLGTSIGVQDEEELLKIFDK